MSESRDRRHEAKRCPVSPELGAFIDRVFIPALLERLLSERFRDLAETKPVPLGQFTASA